MSTRNIDNKQSLSLRLSTLIFIKGKYVLRVIKSVFKVVMNVACLVTATRIEM